MASIAYNALWRVLHPFVKLQLSRRAKSGKEDSARLSERFGHGYQTTRPKGLLIWLHAVSVGESVAAISLVRACKQIDSDLHFLITTNTKTAAARVQAVSESLSIIHVYQPLDHPDWVNRFLDFWQPNAAIFLESDFWPNLITKTAKRQIPVYFASSQLSDKAYRNWQKRQSLAKIVFGAAHRIFAVDAHQANIFQTLSKRTDSIVAEGSLKLDLDQLLPNADYVDALTKWKCDASKLLLVLASTHEGEEQALIEGLSRIDAGTRPLVIIAPRHPERGGKLSQQFSIEKRLSQKQLPDASNWLYLADTLGDFGSLFTASDIVVLGGSFIDIGGHNPLEPASFGKPILTGPSYFKNEAAFKSLSDVGALKMLPSSENLPSALQDWSDARKREAAGASGRDIAQHAGQAAGRVARAILNDVRKWGRR